MTHSVTESSSPADESIVWQRSVLEEGATAPPDEEGPGPTGEAAAVAAAVPPEDEPMGGRKRRRKAVNYRGER